jgi:RNA polymerase sigma-70 factor (ECF subfamily)
LSTSAREDSFRLAVLPHLDSAYNLARWLTRSDPDAEDVVQESVLRALRYFDRFHGGDARPWLMGIVRNTFYSWYERNRMQRASTPFDETVHGPELTEAAPADDNPETLLLRKQDRGRVRQALEALALEFREVLVLRELEDLSYKEIAVLIDAPLGTVMSRLARARKQLAEALAQAEGNADGT